MQITIHVGIREGGKELFIFLLSLNWGNFCDAAGQELLSHFGLHLYEVVVSATRLLCLILLFFDGCWLHIQFLNKII